MGLRGPSPWVVGSANTTGPPMVALSSPAGSKPSPAGHNCSGALAPMCRWCQRRLAPMAMVSTHPLVPPMGLERGTQRIAAALCRTRHQGCNFGTETQCNRASCGRNALGAAL